MQINDVLGGYLKLREQKEALARQHKEQMAPINDGMNKMLAWVQQKMQEQGLTNFRGTDGSAFLQTDRSVTSEDWNATLQWIRDNDAWEFLERRISKTVVQDYIEAHNQIPPGIKVSSEICAHIRK